MAFGIWVSKLLNHIVVKSHNTHAIHYYIITTMLWKIGKKYW